MNVLIGLLLLEICLLLNPGDQEALCFSPVVLNYVWVGCVVCACVCVGCGVCARARVCTFSPILLQVNTLTHKLFSVYLFTSMYTYVSDFQFHSSSADLIGLLSLLGTEQIIWSYSICWQSMHNSIECFSLRLYSCLSEVQIFSKALYIFSIFFTIVLSERVSSLGGTEVSRGLMLSPHYQPTHVN